eukprot:TRINITY_DN3790_c0_g3_i1.p1 TRINITY_DN3790_c0_g3~~TRINITY_DN3790_c0_g3_i1.p1  ORF type:complete len:546 (+),score=79.24 TRINITY_DN3790_c0_g3_i1:86-1723(+)
MLWNIFVVAYVLSASVHAFDVRSHLGTFTPYSPQFDASTYQPPPQGCELAQINMVARHGSRNPTRGVSADINALQTKIQAIGKFLAPSQPQLSAWMTTWVNPFASPNMGVPGDLVEQGEAEHYQHAKRELDRHSSFFANLKYTPDSVLLRSTNISRTGVSLSSFAYGLFEEKGDLGASKFAPVFATTMPSDQDPLLRFFDMCPAYDDYSDPDQGTGIPDQQVSAFDSAYISRVASALNTRLKLSSELAFSVDDANSLWEGCAFEASLLNRTQYLCSLLLKEEVELFNIREDIEKYYLLGYGNDLNWQMATLLLADVFQSMERVAGNSKLSTDPTIPSNLNVEGKKMTRSAAKRTLRLSNLYKSHAPEILNLRFAHAETVGPLLALLQLFHDDALNAQLPLPTLLSRQWKSYQLLPFGANSVFYLYKCPSSTYLTSFFHNEKQIPLPACQNAMYCPLSTILRYYSQAASFNFNSICASSSLSKRKSLHAEMSSEHGLAPSSNQPNMMSIIVASAASLCIGVVLSSAFWRKRVQDQKGANVLSQPLV